MADSHGNNELLLNAIRTLKGHGAGGLIHLGDMCDSGSPHLIRQVLDILRDHRVKCVRGNNECNILHNSRDESAARARQGPLAYLQGLPYTIVLGDLWFAHSAPLSYPAATRRPVSEFLPLFMKDRAFAFSILFRGHSHRPSILEIRGHTTEKIPVQPGVDIPLDRRGRYIVTVGAVEAASSVLFLPREYAVRFVAVPRHHA